MIFFSVSSTPGHPLPISSATASASCEGLGLAQDNMDNWNDGKVERCFRIFRLGDSFFAYGNKVLATRSLVFYRVICGHRDSIEHWPQFYLTVDLMVSGMHVPLPLPVGKISFDLKITSLCH